MRRYRGEISANLTGGCGGNLTQTQLDKIADAFGSVSVIGRKKLFSLVIAAVESDWHRRVHSSPPESQLAEYFTAVGNTAQDLNSRLSVDALRDRTSPNMGRAAEQRLGKHVAQSLIVLARDNAHLENILFQLTVPRDGIVVAGTVHGRNLALPHRTVLSLLNMLLESVTIGAKRALEEAKASKGHGRGGARRTGPTTSTEFAEDLIDVYDKMRHRYPQSGRPTGYSPSGPLPRFVLAVFRAARESGFDVGSIKDGSIGPVFRQWAKIHRREAQRH